MEQSNVIVFQISLLKAANASALAATLLAIAGCGNLQSAFVPGPPQQNAANTKPNDSLQSERFHAQPGHVKCRSGSYTRQYANFNVSGIAEGFLPGTFTATGTWSWFSTEKHPSVHFAETFNVRTHSRIISYHLHTYRDSTAKFSCTIFASRGFRLQYRRLDRYNGRTASAYIISNGSFDETFH